MFHFHVYIVIIIVIIDFFLHLSPLHYIVIVRGLNKSSYSSSTHKILEFDLELIESSSSLISFSSQVQVLQYSTGDACELYYFINRVEYESSQIRV